MKLGSNASASNIDTSKINEFCLSDIKYYCDETIKNEKSESIGTKNSPIVIDISIRLKWCMKIKYWCKKHPNSLSLELNSRLLNKTQKPWNRDSDIPSIFSDDKVWISRHSKILVRRTFSPLFVKWSISKFGFQDIWKDIAQPDLLPLVCKVIHILSQVVLDAF